MTVPLVKLSECDSNLRICTRGSFWERPTCRLSYFQCTRSFTASFTVWWPPECHFSTAGLLRGAKSLGIALQLCLLDVPEPEDAFVRKFIITPLHFGVSPQRINTAKTKSLVESCEFHHEEYAKPNRW